MAYDKLEQEQKALEAIKKHNLFFIEEVASFLNMARSTFYFLKLDTLDTIKDALEENKVKIKVKMRKKWFDSDNPALQVANYKLLSTQKEQEALSMKTVEKIVTVQKDYDLANLNDEELEFLEKLKAKMQKQNE